MFWLKKRLKSLSIYFCLGGAWLPSAHLWADPPANVTDFMSLMLDPNFTRQGYAQNFYDSLSQDEVGTTDSLNRMRDRYTERYGDGGWLAEGEAYHEELTQKTLEDAQRGLFKSFGVDIAFTSKAPLRYQAFQKSNSSQPRLNTTEEAEAIARQQLVIPDYLKPTELNMRGTEQNSAIARRALGYEGLESFTRKQLAPRLLNQKWLASEIQLTKEQIQSANKAMLYLWVKNFPGSLRVALEDPHVLPADLKGDYDTRVPEHVKSRPLTLDDLEQSAVFDKQFDLERKIPGAYGEYPIFIRDNNGKEYPLLFRNSIKSEPFYLTARNKYYPAYLDIPSVLEASKVKMPVKEFLLMQILRKVLDAPIPHLNNVDSTDPGKLSELMQKASERNLKRSRTSHSESLFWYAVKRHATQDPNREADLGFLWRKDEVAQAMGSKRFAPFGASVGDETASQFKALSALSSRTAATNSPKLEVEPVFSIRKGLGTVLLPKEFWYGRITDLPDSEIQLAELSRGASAHHTIENKIPLLDNILPISIPRAHGFMLQSFSMTDPHGEMYKLGVDFDLLEDHNGDYLSVKFKRQRIINNKDGVAYVNIKAGFAKGPRRKSTQEVVPKLDLGALRIVAQQLRAAKIIPLANAIDAFSYSSKATKGTLQDLGKIFRAQGLYSYFPESEYAAPGAKGPFAYHSRFINEDGIMCYQCDGADELFRAFLNEYFLRSGSKLKAVGKLLLRREGDSLVKPGHAITAVQDPEGLELERIDTTAAQPDPRVAPANFIEKREIAREEYVSPDLSSRVVREQIEVARAEIYGHFSNPQGFAGSTSPNDYIANTLKLLRQIDDHLRAHPDQSVPEELRARASEIAASLKTLETYIQTHEHFEPELKKYLNPAAIAALRSALALIERTKLLNTSRTNVSSECGTALK